MARILKTVKVTVEATPAETTIVYTTVRVFYRPHPCGHAGHNQRIRIVSRRRESYPRKE